MTKEQYEIAKETISQVNNYFETDCRVKSRKTTVVRPRMYACKIIRELTGMNLEDIGDMFGLTHGSVIHAINTVDNDLELNSKFKKYYIELRGAVEATRTYKYSRIGRSNITNDIRMEVYNALMSKDAKHLRKILNIIK
jgi:hypothetical protein